MVLESESVHSGSDQRSFVRGSNEESQIEQQRIHIELGKDHRISYPDQRTGGSSSHSQRSGERRSGEQMGMAALEVSHLGWGHWYTLRELEVATNGFAHENVIGEGGYGIVYKGVLEDGTFLAVKNLLNNRGQAEREFKVEVEAIGRVRHKNLVRLLGYCAEGAHRGHLFCCCSSPCVHSSNHGVEVFLGYLAFLTLGGAYVSLVAGATVDFALCVSVLDAAVSLFGLTGSVGI